jgi:hypothetical protein
MPLARQMVPRPQDSASPAGLKYLLNRSMPAAEVPDPPRLAVLLLVDCSMSMVAARIPSQIEIFPIRDGKTRNLYGSAFFPALQLLCRFGETT